MFFAFAASRIFAIASLPFALKPICFYKKSSPSSLEDRNRTKIRRLPKFHRVNSL